MKFTNGLRIDGYSITWTYPDIDGEPQLFSEVYRSKASASARMTQLVLDIGIRDASCRPIYRQTPASAALVLGVAR